MTFLRKIKFVVGVGALAFAGSNSFPENDADNTRVNSRDQLSYEMTADQQSMDKKDEDLIRRIRREIVRDKSFSTYAHNVKIISSGGVVTLKGPVRTQEERQKIITKAQNFAGAANIIDEMDVVPMAK